MPSGRNAFDLSQVRTFTSRAGLIDICYAQPFVAGTKGKLSRECFTRTAQVVSPAFHDVTEHYDFFIVPIHSLWRQWENWKLNINDLQDTFSVPYNSSVGHPDLNLPENAPRLDFSELISRLGYMSPASQFNLYTVNQKCQRGNNLLRLCDQLRYSDAPPFPKDDEWPAVMNLFMIAAYQKCYFDHYRRTDYESNNPYAYNLDWLYDGTHNGLLDPQPSNYTSKDQYVARELFTMRSVNYRNDAFMNIYPGLSYVQSTPAGNTWLVPSNVGGIGTSASTGKPGVSPNGNAFVSSTGTTDMRNFTAQGIRAMFALDKLMRASAYAPKHVRDQYKALYGVEGVEDFDMRSERIGSFQSSVNFTEVLNMAQSAEYNLGDLGARGIGGDRSKKFFNFYCKYDSIVIGLHYFMPRARYDAVGMHPWNVKIAREDFYVKAFENLGLRPMYAYNLAWSPNVMSNAVVGWTVPNHDYKILPDLNFGEFRQSYSFIDTDGTNVYAQTQSSELSTFVPHSGLALLNTIDGVTYESFKVLPQDLDNLFVVKMPFTSEWGLYQFYGNCRINVLVVAPMSVHGQPVL